MTLAEPRRRRRWPLILLIVLVVLAVLVGVLAAIGEGIARQQVSRVGSSTVAAALGIPRDRVTTDPGAPAVLPQVLAGRIDDLAVTAQGVDLQGVTADMRAHFRDVALDGSTAGSANAQVTIPAAQLAALASSSGGAKVDRIRADAPDLVADASTRVLGLSVPVSVRLAATASGGAVVLTPVEITVAGASFSAGSIGSGPFGDVARPYLKPQRFCVATHIPSGLHLDSATVSGSNLVLGLSGRDLALGGSKGSCT